jgi:hypothetical protein
VTASPRVKRPMQRTITTAAVFSMSILSIAGSFPDLRL